MRRRDVEKIAASLVPGSGAPDIRRLGSGLVNETYRVTRGSADFSLRLPLGDAYDLGVDREWEAEVLQGAAAAGLSPVVEFCDPQRGILISRWVNGRCWSPAEARQPPNIRAVAALARRIHALPIPTPARLITPANWIHRYRTACLQAGPGAMREESTPAEPAPAAREGASPLEPRAPAGKRPSDAEVAEDIEALAGAAAGIAAELGGLPGVDFVVCHSDLHGQNVIDSGRELFLLDWEYAHVTDPFWDLAGWSANNDFEDDARRDLLTLYLARPPTREEWSRLRLLGWLYDYVCLLWSELYLRLRGRAAGAGPQAAADSVSGRLRLLAVRLHASLSQLK